MISVIVPVYNVGKYLKRCVDSILNQTYTDFELLLVDDGSRDFSGRLCDEYAEIHPNIRVFHTENRGAAAARNYGIEQAKGKLITFVDSDDTVTEDHLAYLRKLMTQRKKQQKLRTQKKKLRKLRTQKKKLRILRTLI